MLTPVGYGPTFGSNLCPADPAEPNRRLAGALHELRLPLSDEPDPVPDAWLEGAGGDELRAAYAVWLRARRAALPHIIEEAARVRAARV